MDGHGIGYGGRGSAVASAVPLDVRARIPQRQGHRHQESARSTSSKKLRVGVFQVSAIREALSEHGVANNTVIHYLSHNADTGRDNQPSYQVQQVIDGSLDIAAAWGPMAGYYKAVKHAPLIIKPVNLMEDEIPIEFNMTLAVPRGRPDIKAAVQNALAQHKDEIHQILVDFGVPLVKCDECSGVRRSSFAWAVRRAEADTRDCRGHREDRMRARMAELKKWLAQGANPDNELADAIVAHDVDRVRLSPQSWRARRFARRRWQYAAGQRHSVRLRRCRDVACRPQGRSESARPAATGRRSCMRRGATAPIS